MSRILLFMVFMVLPFHVAQAEVFYYDSPRGHFSVSFPDDWRVINNQKPNDMLTIAAPGQAEEVQCRVRVQQDRRFSMYPARFSDEIRSVSFSQDFWKDYLMEYKDAEILGVNDNAGFGRGFASYAEAKFTNAVGVDVDKHGLMFVSLYGDKLYVAECAAHADYFVKWRPAFMNFMKSVDFTKTVQEHPRGNYRDFLGSPLKIYGPKNVDAGRY